MNGAPFKVQVKAIRNPVWPLRLSWEFWDKASALKRYRKWVKLGGMQVKLYHGDLLIKRNFDPITGWLIKDDDDDD